MVIGTACVVSGVLLHRCADGHSHSQQQLTTTSPQHHSDHEHHEPRSSHDIEITLVSPDRHDQQEHSHHTGSGYRTLPATSPEHRHSTTHSTVDDTSSGDAAVQHVNIDAEARRARNSVGVTRYDGHVVHHQHPITGAHGTTDVY